MTIGEKLKKKRLEKGYTQEELANRLGISSATVWKYEKDRTSRLTIEQLQPFCEALDCNVLWLMGMTELDESTENIMDAIDADDKLFVAIRDACIDYNGMGLKFDRKDYEDIINYIKFKAMQKG